MASSRAVPKDVLRWIRAKKRALLATIEGVWELAERRTQTLWWSYGV